LGLKYEKRALKLSTWLIFRKERVISKDDFRNSKEQISKFEEGKTKLLLTV
jgi:hypothetical protein